ncbi:hypothetical protein Tco_1260249 [Tanacetum coccineum]
MSVDLCIRVYVRSILASICFHAYQQRSKVDKFNSALKYHLPVTKGDGLEVLVDAKEKLMQTASVSIDCEWSKERLKRMMSLNSSGSHNAVVKNNNMKKGSHHIPMLDSKDLWMDKKLIRGKEHKKVTRRIVETVHLTCGKNDEDWLIIPIVNQIKRLSFSKILD